MGLRVTDNILQRSSLSDVGRARVRLAEVQEQASSGLRINRPSDDPVGYQTANSLRAAVAEGQQLLRNHDRALDRLNRQDAALGEAQDVVQRARELALRGASGSPNDDPEVRNILADEVEGLYQELLSQANLDSPDGFLFGGHASDTMPFSIAGSFGAAPPAPVTSFVGDSNEVEIEIDNGVRIATTLDGRRAFLGDGDNDGSPDPGREDAFSVLGDLWESLVNNDPAATSAQIGRLDTAARQLSAERTRVASATQRVESAQSGARDRDVDLQRQLSNVQDADTVSVLSELVSRETALQSALQAASRVLQPSLLNFLR